MWFQRVVEVEEIIDEDPALQPDSSLDSSRDDQVHTSQSPGKRKAPPIQPGDFQRVRLLRKEQLRQSLPEIFDMHKEDQQSKKAIELELGDDNEDYYINQEEVPPPLRYVPYSPQPRQPGLGPEIRGIYDEEREIVEEPEDYAVYNLDESVPRRRYPTRLSDVLEEGDDTSDEAALIRDYYRRERQGDVEDDEEFSEAIPRHYCSTRLSDVPSALANAPAYTAGPGLFYGRYKSGITESSETNAEFQLYQQGSPTFQQDTSHLDPSQPIRLQPGPATQPPPQAPASTATTSANTVPTRKTERPRKLTLKTNIRMGLDGATDEERHIPTAYEQFQALNSPASPIILGKRHRKTLFDAQDDDDDSY